MTAESTSADSKTSDHSTKKKSRRNHGPNTNVRGPSRVQDRSNTSGPREKEDINQAVDSDLETVDKLHRMDQTLSNVCVESVQSSTEGQSGIRFEADINSLDESVAEFNEYYKPSLKLGGSTAPPRENDESNIDTDTSEFNSEPNHGRDISDAESIYKESEMTDKLTDADRDRDYVDARVGQFKAEITSELKDIDIKIVNLQMEMNRQNSDLKNQIAQGFSDVSTKHADTDAKLTILDNDMKSTKSYFESSFSSIPTYREHIKVMTTGAIAVVGLIAAMLSFSTGQFNAGLGASPGFNKLLEDQATAFESKITSSNKELRSDISELKNLIMSEIQISKDIENSKDAQSETKN